MYVYLFAALIAAIVIVALFVIYKKYYSSNQSDKSQNVTQSEIQPDKLDMVSNSNMIISSVSSEMICNIYALNGTIKGDLLDSFRYIGPLTVAKVDRLAAYDRLLGIPHSQEVYLEFIWNGMRSEDIGEMRVRTKGYAKFTVNNHVEFDGVGFDNIGRSKFGGPGTDCTLEYYRLHSNDSLQVTFNGLPLTGCYVKSGIEPEEPKQVRLLKEAGIISANFKGFHIIPGFTIESGTNTINSTSSDIVDEMNRQITDIMPGCILSRQSGAFALKTLSSPISLKLVRSLTDITYLRIGHQMTDAILAQFEQLDYAIRLRYLSLGKSVDVSDGIITIYNYAPDKQFIGSRFYYIPFLDNPEWNNYDVYWKYCYPLNKPPTDGRQIYRGVLDVKLVPSPNFVTYLRWNEKTEAAVVRSLMITN